MSTAAPTRKTIQPRALRPSLQQPLLRLQSAIRRYVTLESLGLLVIAVTAWMCVSIHFDHVVLFQWFGLDYLWEGSSGVRALLRGTAILALAVIVGWIFVRYFVVRIIRPLDNSDLAMVLERHYSSNLGDKLVTAVELNDWDRAVEHGYSSEMLKATTAEAERELARVSIPEVLNRGRLNKLLGLAAFCAVLVTAASCLLPEVVLTWFERTLMFRNVPWPRATILEIADFHDRTRAVPSGSELKVTVRSARWAVADRSVSEGWRPLSLSDLTRKSAVAWELTDFPQPGELLAVLPAAWHTLTIDQIENQLLDAGPGMHRALGLALIRKLQDYFWEHRQEASPLPAELAAFLPEKLRQMPIAQQKVALAAAGGLSSVDAERILQGLATQRPTVGDAALAMRHLSMMPTPLPLPCLSLLQKIAIDRDCDCPPFAMPETERALLPVEWQTKMPIRDLAKRLRTYAAEESAESLGKQVAQRASALIESLQERAGHSRFTYRKEFRQLQVPEKVTLEFENIAEADDRSRNRAKRGQPELKRSGGANEFSYEFKKVERPMRLRAGVKGMTTPWHRVEVKPLPTLKSLVRFHEEPAYLYGSSQKVRVGPLVLPLDGEESRAIAPSGSIVWFEGESHKPLKSVKVTSENQVELPRVVFQEGATKFKIEPPTSVKEDLRFKIEYEDQDGIRAGRVVLLMLTPDKPPEFLKAQFEAVNRKFITAKAILPLSLTVRDDVGLLSLQYEVSIQKNDRSASHEVKLPLRVYSPVRISEPQPGGMRFDQPEDLTMPRVFAQLDGLEGGDPMQVMSAAARLPGGWGGVFPPLRAGLRREFQHDYVDRQLYGPVLSYNDEFLDTLMLRSALNKPVNEPIFETPYRMVVRLAARDNRMREEGATALPAHQESRANEAFEFNVVSEQDVIIEGSKREEDLRDRFEEIITSLRKVRSSLKRVRDELDVPSPPKDDDVRRSMNDAQDATKSLAQIRLALDEKVLREFRQIYREFALNRVDERVLDRIDRRICNPLAILLQPEQSFAKLESGVDVLARRLESEGASLPKNLLSEPVAQSDRVLAKLEEILNDMRKLIEFNEALRVLRDLIQNEQKLVDEMKRLIKQKLEKDLDDK